MEEILRRARCKDADALEALISRFSPRIYGLLYRMTGSREDADDLLQETFLRVVRTIDQYEHTGRFESWLFRITANLARDRLRRKKRRADTVGLDGEAGAYGGTTEDRALVYDHLPDFALLRSESQQRIAAAMEKLSEPEREILLLRHYAELPFREIADLLNIPLGTALARAHRALSRLRDELTDATERLDQ
jgi:RNA polymerase sigma-70 factor (ECF subfamily)